MIKFGILEFCRCGLPFFIIVLRMNNSLFHQPHNQTMQTLRQRFHSNQTQKSSLLFRLSQLFVHNNNSVF
ncbi:hypothetical protein CICLE_v10023212mg [Citrus x clementina]|uniref:Uncharacterized protein n=1 Tax=Citrus clementina TaxID=85681 RepID=V4VTM7_CITCL|nr:hypothetical protein CICLE_v10023212mg [Citrus x clementina]